MPNYGNTGGKSIIMDGQNFAYGMTQEIVGTGGQFFMPSVGDIINVPLPDELSGYTRNNPYHIQEIDTANGVFIGCYPSMGSNADLRSVGKTEDVPITNVCIYYLNNGVQSVWGSTLQFFLYGVERKTLTNLVETDTISAPVLQTEFNITVISGKNGGFIDSSHYNPLMLHLVGQVNIKEKYKMTLTTEKQLVALNTTKCGSDLLGSIDKYYELWGYRFAIPLTYAINGVPQAPQQDDNPMPYPSGGGGGGGGYGGSNEPDTFDPLPPIGAVGSGFLQLYSPNQTELSLLGQYLWSDNLLDNIQKIYTDPMDYIVTLNIVPCPVDIAGTKSVYIGGLNSGVTMTYLSSEYVKVNLGQIYVPEYYGSALDYAPYTKATITLPFVGSHSINIDEIMGSYVEVEYNINVFNGSAVAMVKIMKNLSGGDANNLSNVLYRYPCNVISTIEINSKNYSNIVGGMLKGVATAGIGLVSGGMGVALGTLATSGLNVAGTKPTFDRGSGYSGSSGIMSNRFASIVLERPIQSYAQNFNHYEGLPSNITSKVKNLKGYTEFESIEMKGLTCHETEKREIEQILKSGFYA